MHCTVFVGEILFCIVIFGFTFIIIFVLQLDQFECFMFYFKLFIYLHRVYIVKKADFILYPP